ncbi:MAG: VCBS repeat-containing protein, partial [Flavitalea sp.]
MFRILSPEQTGIDFANTLQYSDSLSVLDFEYMFNGGGVALLDVNGDGLMDVLFTGNMVSSRLYLNKGGMKFEDITRQSGIATTGWCYGASVVDINQDGYPDIYICKAGNRKTPADSMRNVFFINNGNNTFTESAKKMGLDDDGYDVQAVFLDYDHDGDLDMYLLRNGFVSYNRNTVRLKQTDGQAPSTNRLMRNNGNGTFTNVSMEAGITIEGFGLGVSVCDLNDDGWPDLYVSNDFLTNDVLWINNRNGTFTNAADKMLRHTTYNAMGNDVADFNNDGKEDIVEVDMLPPDNKRWKLTMMGNTYEQFSQGLDFGYQPQYVRNSLQVNNGNGTFSEIGQLSGVSATEWSWAPLFADFDNDGSKDLFIANGYRQDVTNLDFIMYGKRSMMGTPEANRKDRIYMLRNFPGIKTSNYIFRNNGDLTFTNLAKEWGIDDATYSNGAAYGDLDNDGDLDLVVNNLDQPASVYENRLNNIATDNKWLSINFKGPPGNRDGLGTKVYLWQGTRLQYQYFSPYRGYLSTVEPYLHFGIGNKAVDSLKVIWPDGEIQLIKNITVNKLMTLSYADALQAQPVNVQVKSAPLFTECSKELNIRYRHKEDEFVDFKLQPIMPHMLSHEGPGISVADVNSDGREDFFIGGAAGSKGNLFTQQANGTFIQHVFPDSNLADNMGSLFIDVDNDGDNDLYVVNGGICASKNGDTVYRHSLYLNNGKGKFALAKNALPAINTSGSSVIAADYDNDGDPDLFICGRVSPGEYPLPASSFLLRNDSKNGVCAFTDVTAQSGINGKLGMVTSALWTDFNNDGWQDLIILGEFMPIRFFKNNKGHFQEVTDQTSLEHTGGWWNSIVAGDFDHDGDIDYVVGNLGLNGPYKASSTEPVCIYAQDYDKN